jgi:TRAP-type C4-dicarboxylate transport system substrate-binding protein
VWNKLGPDQQKVFRAAAAEAIANQRRINAENVGKLLKKLESEGMKVNKVADPAAFQAKVKPVYQEFKPSIGEDIFGLAMEAVK